MICKYWVWTMVEVKVLKIPVKMFWWESDHKYSAGVPEIGRYFILCHLFALAPHWEWGSPAVSPSETI